MLENALRQERKRWATQPKQQQDTASCDAGQVAYEGDDQELLRAEFSDLDARWHAIMERMIDDRSKQQGAMCEDRSNCYGGEVRQRDTDYDIADQGDNHDDQNTLGKEAMDDDDMVKSFRCLFWLCMAVIRAVTFALIKFSQDRAIREMSMQVGGCGK